MIAVIFEVNLKQDGVQGYFDQALSLKKALIKMPGFISVERFQSLAETEEEAPAKILSLSFWQDEAAVIAWRNQMMHNKAQVLGREELFDDYRIRVASVIRDYGLTERVEAPKAFG